jgi:hypothetical protein
VPPNNQVFEIDRHIRGSGYQFEPSSSNSVGRRDGSSLTVHTEKSRLDYFDRIVGSSNLTQYLSDLRAERPESTTCGSSLCDSWHAPARDTFTRAGEIYATRQQSIQPKQMIRPEKIIAAYRTVEGFVPWPLKRSFKILVLYACRVVLAGCFVFSWAIRQIVIPLLEFLRWLAFRLRI